jgi:hypothetical protein
MYVDAQKAGLLIEKMERFDLIGKKVRLSNGQEGPIVFVEYESPERVALVQTYPETPSPLTRISVDRLSPPHLPFIVEIDLEPREAEG